MKKKVTIIAIIVISLSVLAVLLFLYGSRKYMWEFKMSGYMVLEDNGEDPNICKDEYTRKVLESKEDVRLNMDITLLTGEVTVKLYQNEKLYSENTYTGSTSVELLEWEDFDGEFYIEFEWSEDVEGYINTTLETRQTNFEHIKEKIKNTIHL